MSPAGSKNAPEAKARDKIDVSLEQAGWVVQDREDMNLKAGDVVAVREFKLEKGHGYVDYLLFVDGQALGVIEAKPAGYSFTSVEFQAKKYVEGMPESLTAAVKPLPFAYISTGEETVFINTLDPQPRILHAKGNRRAELQCGFCGETQVVGYYPDGQASPQLVSRLHFAQCHGLIGCEVVTIEAVERNGAEPPRTFTVDLRTDLRSPTQQ